MKKVCIRCKKRPFAVKKHKLCSACYQRWYMQLKKKRGFKIPNYKIQHESEVEFIKNFFTHTNWIHHPAIFRMSKTRYEPDFYDGERGVFIEVAGTTQAFYANVEKYKDFMIEYKHIKFEIRHTDGKLMDVNAGRQDWPEK